MKAEKICFKIDSDVVWNEEAQLELKAFTQNGRQERGHVLSHLHTNIFCKFSWPRGWKVHAYQSLAYNVHGEYYSEKNHKIKQNTLLRRSGT